QRPAPQNCKSLPVRRGAGLRPAVDSAGGAEKAQLEQVYSRGLGPYFLTGTNHQAVVKGRSPRHRGILSGRVVRADRTGIVIESNDAAQLKPGDGIVFDA